MFGLEKLVKDVVDITGSTVSAAVDVTRTVTKPLADAAKSTAEVVKDISDDITGNKK